VLRNFHILRAILAKHEAESPLLVDADAVLALTISCERLEAVARRGTRKSSRLIAASSCCSFASARLRMSGGWERTGSSANAAAVSLSLNDLIATAYDNEVRY